MESTPRLGSSIAGYEIQLQRLCELMRRAVLWRGIIWYNLVLSSSEASHNISLAIFQG